MRKTFLSAAVLAAGLTGCSDKAGPVVVTPEMEAEQRRAEKEVHDAETAMRKQQKNAPSGARPSGEEEEAARRRK